jgi:hypothetical protein
VLDDSELDDSELGEDEDYDSEEPESSDDSGELADPDSQPNIDSVCEFDFGIASLSMPANIDIASITDGSSSRTPSGRVVIAFSANWRPC